jgi:PAS domain S-box-containing protein
MNQQDTKFTTMAFRCRADAALGFEYANEGSERVVGYTKTDLVESGRVCLPDLIQPAWRETVRKQIQDGIDRQGLFVILFGLLSKDKTGAEGILIGTGIFDSPLTITGIEGFIIKMDNTSQSPESPIFGLGEFLKRTLELSAEILIYLGEDGKIGYTTPSVMHVLGYLEEQITGEPFTMILMPEEQIRFKEFKEQAQMIRGGERSQQFSGRKGDGSPVQVLIQFTAFNQNGNNTIVMVSLAR